MMTLIIFFFNDTATTEIYTLSLHDALPIYHYQARRLRPRALEPHAASGRQLFQQSGGTLPHQRSEEHTSELQSRSDLVCRLLLEKKKNKRNVLASISVTHDLHI